MAARRLPRGQGALTARSAPQQQRRAWSNNNRRSVCGARRRQRSWRSASRDGAVTQCNRTSRSRRHHGRVTDGTPSGRRARGVRASAGRRCARGGCGGRLRARAVSTQLLRPRAANSSGRRNRHAGRNCRPADVKASSESWALGGKNGDPPLWPRKRPRGASPCRHRASGSTAPPAACSPRTDCAGRVLARR